MTRNDLRTLATRPSVVVTSLTLGISVGWLFPIFSHQLAIISDIYLALLKMIVLPLMVSAVIFSVHRLLIEGQTGRLVSRMTYLFLLVMFAAVLVGVVTNFAMPPGKDLPPETMAQLGRVVGSVTLSDGNDQMALNGPDMDETAVSGPTLTGIVWQLIPDNIFAALARGEMLKAFMFALLFGCALAGVPIRAAETFSRSMESVFNVCQILTGWFNYFLPIILFCMVASQISQTGLEPLQAMVGFLAAVFVASGGLMLGAFWVLVRSSGLAWRQVLVSQREPLTMALATQNAQACMPSMIESLVGRLGFAAHHVELLIPLGVSLLRVGQVVYFVLATFFIAHLYDRPLGIQEIFIIGIGSVLAGLATTGMTGLLVLAQIGLVCNFLHLPFEAALALFVIVDPVCSVLRTIVQVCVTNAWAAAVCGRPSISAGISPVHKVEAKETPC